MNMIQWAREFAGLDVDTAYSKLKIDKDILQKWESGKVKPNYSDIKNLSDKYKVPLGYFFLKNPPVMKTSLVEYRTHEHVPVEKASLNLTEMIYFAKDIQQWYRNYLIQENAKKIPLQKSDYKDVNVQIISQNIRKLFNIESVRKKSTLKTFTNDLIHQLEQQNFLIIKTSIVGNNIHRKILPEECKGFCIYDDYAPVIFVNAADFLKSQTFTLVHELAHLFFRHNSLDKDLKNNVESLCNQIASEVLVPSEECKNRLNVETAFSELEKKFKVSSFVVLIKFKQLKLISDDEFEKKWNDRLQKIKPPKKESGGDFYNNVSFKCGGKPFLTSVLNSVIEGKTSYKEGFYLTNLNRDTFDKAYQKIIKRDK